MASISLYSLSILGSIPSELLSSAILFHHQETHFVFGLHSSRAQIGSNLYPPSPQRIIQDHSHKESSTHVPHCKSGHDEHHVEIGFLISNVFYHNSQFRTREEQDYSQDGIGENLKDDRHGVTEKKGNQNEHTSQNHQGAACLCPEANMTGHSAGPVTHRNTTKKG